MEVVIGEFDTTDIILNSLKMKIPLWNKVAGVAPQLLTTSNFIGPWYHVALLFSWNLQQILEIQVKRFADFALPLKSRSCFMLFLGQDMLICVAIFPILSAGC